MEKMETMMPPPPIPWKTRAAISESIDQATPQSSEPTTKIAMAASITNFRPKRSPSLP